MLFETNCAQCNHSLITVVTAVIADIFNTYNKTCKKCLDKVNKLTIYNALQKTDANKPKCE